MPYKPLFPGTETPRTTLFQKFAEQLNAIRERDPQTRVVVVIQYAYRQWNKGTRSWEVKILPKVKFRGTAENAIQRLTDVSDQMHKKTMWHMVFGRIRDVKSGENDLFTKESGSEKS